MQLPTISLKINLFTYIFLNINPVWIINDIWWPELRETEQPCGWLGAQNSLKFHKVSENLFAARGRHCFVTWRHKILKVINILVTGGDPPDHWGQRPQYSKIPREPIFGQNLSQFIVVGGHSIFIWTKIGGDVKHRPITIFLNRQKYIEITSIPKQIFIGTLKRSPRDPWKYYNCVKIHFSFKVKYILQMDMIF